MEKEKDSLEGARNEALNYIRTENAVAVKNHMLLQRYMYVEVLLCVGLRVHTQAGPKSLCCGKPHMEI